MKIIITAAVVALLGMGSIALCLQSELETQRELVGKQSEQLINKQLEVDGLASEVYQLSKQADDFVADQVLTADLNTQHQQSEEVINEKHVVAMINSNELKVSEHAWSNTALPHDAGRLLYQATGSPDYHRDKGGNASASKQLPSIGLRTAAVQW